MSGSAGRARGAALGALAMALAAALAAAFAAGAAPPPPKGAAAATPKPRPRALNDAADKALRAELARRKLEPSAVEPQLEALRAADPWVALVQGADRIGGAGAFAYMALDQAFAELGVPPAERMALADDADAADQLTALGEQMKLFQDPALGIPEPWCASFAQLAVDLARARRLAAQALAGIPPASRTAIAAGLLDLAGVAELRDANAVAIDFAALARATATMLLASDAFLEALPERVPPAFSWRTDVAGVSGFALGPFPTMAGPLYLGSVDANVWSVPRNAIVVDLGGQDTYTMGDERYTPPAEGAALGVVLDIAGDDAYRPAAPAAVGAGVLGLALVRDVAGDDVYEDRALGQGVGLFGAGLLLDQSGDDRYVVGTSGQGCAYAGVGLLVDGGGEDAYIVTSFGQGVAAGQAVGLLVDLSGDDVYRARAEIAYDGQLGAAQGAGFRVPPEGPPGLGVLLDVAGNDTYLAVTQAQGFAGRGRGLLVDGGGDDVTTAGTQSQAAAIGGVALLLDLGGNDVRLLRGADGQARGVSSGTSALLDTGGTDVLRCGDEKTCRGVAEGEGRALFIDLGVKPPVRIGLPTKQKAKPAPAPASPGQAAK